jgi:FixJ family two-component response regulator
MEIAMTHCLHGETVADQSQGVRLAAIGEAAPNFSVTRLMTKMDAAVPAHKIAAPSAMFRGTPVVFVVDNDACVRESLGLLTRHAGWQPETFESVQEFLHREQVLVPNCLILDIALAGVGVLDLQKRLAAERKDMPIIFVAAHSDIAMTVQAMKAGAFDFLIKPFGDDELLNAARQAIECSRTAIDHEVEIRGLRDRYASLSRREREVMELLVSGLLNKQVGFELGIGEVTVKAHRGQVMRKMKAGSFADLVKITEKLRLSEVA